MNHSIALGPALLLGIIQGVTEFLPISSSGHLALANWFFGVKEGGLALVMLVHAGTLLSVVIVFRRETAALVRGTFALPRHLGKPPAAWPEPVRNAALVAVATIPGVLAGYFVKDSIESAFGDMRSVGWQFLLTGAILFATRAMKPGSRDVSWKSALVIGIAQAISILPAISRSGATIAAAIFLGVSRPKAGEFSFVISIPIILGAVLLERPELAGGEFSGQAVPLAAAFAASFAVGWISLIWLLGVIRNGRFHWFAPYCVLIGVLTILFA